jgi:hypothetical protein
MTIRVETKYRYWCEICKSGSPGSYPTYNECVPWRDMHENTDYHKVRVKVAAGEYVGPDDRKAVDLCSSFDLCANTPTHMNGMCEEHTAKAIAFWEGS